MQYNNSVGGFTDIEFDDEPRLILTKMFLWEKLPRDFVEGQIFAPRNKDDIKKEVYLINLYNRQGEVA